MKMDIVEDESNSLIIEFDGIDRGILDLIKEKMIGNKDVDFVTVTKMHPESSTTRLVIKASKSPRSLLQKAVSDAEKEVEEMRDAIKKK